MINSEDFATSETASDVFNPSGYNRVLNPSGFQSVGGQIGYYSALTFWSSLDTARYNVKRKMVGQNVIVGTSVTAGMGLITTGFDRAESGLSEPTNSRNTNFAMFESDSVGERCNRKISQRKMLKKTLKCPKP